MNSIEEDFKKILHKRRRGLRQTTTEKCDAILAFCPIVSRAGTDISAALDRLDSHHVSKPVILVVLHHTFEAEKIIPNSSAVVKRQQTLSVDCLFYEDEGLLQCQRNENAVNKIVEYLKSQKLNSYACLKENHASPCPDIQIRSRNITQDRFKIPSVFKSCLCVD